MTSQKNNKMVNYKLNAVFIMLQGSGRFKSDNLIKQQQNLRLHPQQLHR